MSSKLRSMKLRFLSALPTSLPTIAFLSTTFIETIVDIAIVAILLSSFEGSFVSSVLARDDGSVLPVYLGLFVFAHLFQLVLAMDALAAKNMIQIMGLLIFNSLFLVYSVIQITDIYPLVSGPVLRILIWIIPAMIAFTEVTYLATFYFIYREFGWQVYKRIGADRRVKKMFMWYQVFLCILKFDVFFFIAFSLQLVLLVLQQNAVERYLTVAALPATLLLLLFGYLAVRKEIKSLFWTFLVGCVAGAAYFVYKLFVIYRNKATDYQLVFKSLTVFAALCLAALLWTSTTAVICFRNFDAGLKYHMQKNANSAGEAKDSGRYMLESANNSRMSID